MKFWWEDILVWVNRGNSVALVTLHYLMVCVHTDRNVTLRLEWDILQNELESEA